MNKKINIYCEGVTDQVFIADIIELFFSTTLSKKKNRKDKNKWEIATERIEIIDIEGCDKLNMDIHINSMNENTIQGGINIVIFDADKNGNGNNGFDSAKVKLNNIKERANFNYYLWPNNTQDGEVENLLIQLIPEGKKTIFDCFKTQIDCLNSLKMYLPSIRIPSVKEQLNFYLYTLEQKSNERDRDYKNNELWYLDLDKCNDLKMFIDFLRKYFEE